MVLTPSESVAMGRGHIDTLREATEISANDRAIIDAAERMEVALVLFRGSDGEGARWGFAPDLPEHLADQLAVAVLERQLPVYRQLMLSGVCLFVHADWGEIETEAFRRAIDRLVAEYGARLGARPDPKLEADLWILKNLVFFFTLGHEQLLRTVLPSKLPMLEARMARVREMVEHAHGADARAA